MPPSVVNRKIQISGRIKYEMQKRAKNILVFRNGDEYTRAIAVLLKHFEQKTLELVIKAVGEKVFLASGLPIRRLFTMEGEALIDADQLEENRSYVASGQEAFIPCMYGQALPNIICGPNRKAERIRYLNSVSTPMPGKQRSKMKSNSTDSITPRTSRQIISDNKTPRNRMEKTSSKPIKNISKPKVNEQLNVENETIEKDDDKEIVTFSEDNSKQNKPKPVKAIIKPKDSNTSKKDKELKTVGTKNTIENASNDPTLSEDNDNEQKHMDEFNHEDGYDQTNDTKTETEDNGKQEEENFNFTERDPYPYEDNADNATERQGSGEQMDEFVHHAATIIQAGYRGHRYRLDYVIE